MADYEIEAFGVERYHEAMDLWTRCEGIGLSAADSEKPLSVYLERNPNMSFVAVSNGAVVGAILAGHDGRRGYVHHLAVDSAFRRQGIGRALMERSLDALRDNGITKCHLFVFRKNPAAVAFWQTNGWELREDLHVMSREL